MGEVPLYTHKWPAWQGLAVSGPHWVDHSERKAGWEPDVALRKSTNERNGEGGACMRGQQLPTGSRSVYIFRGKKAPCDRILPVSRRGGRFRDSLLAASSSWRVLALQGYLAHKKPPPPRTIHPPLGPLCTKLRTVSGTQREVFQFFASPGKPVDVGLESRHGEREEEEDVEVHDLLTILGGRV